MAKLFCYFSCLFFIYSKPNFMKKNTPSNIKNMAAKNAVRAIIFSINLLFVYPHLFAQCPLAPSISGSCAYIPSSALTTEDANLVMTNSSIYYAEIAIHANNSSSFESEVDVTGSCIINNEIGLFFGSGNITGASNSTIIDNEIAYSLHSSKCSHVRIPGKDLMNTSFPHQDFQLYSKPF